jgi:DNA polymerase III gamma/tau subunit
MKRKKPKQDKLELYRRYRPKSFKDIIGQKEQLQILSKFVKKGNLPHCIMLTGITGIGKTTIARILKNKLQCNDLDYKEVNCASDRGIDAARDISNNIWTGGLAGPTRVWCLDEFHQTTTAAQQSLLKTLEDFPPHAYIFILTSEPHKVIKAIHSRSTQIKLSPLQPSEICQLVQHVADREEIELTEDVRDKIAEVSEGSARKALVVLNQIQGLSNEEEMLEAIQKADLKKAAFDLAKLLFYPKPSWKDISKAIKDMEEEPETVRRVILGYAQTVCLGGGANMKRAAAVLDSFREPLYDIGKPGLTLCCYDVVFG